MGSVAIILTVAKGLLAIGYLPTAKGLPPSTFHLHYPHLMLSVQQLLSGKRTNTIIAVHPDQTVIEALEIMATHNIGAVLVLRDERLVGIFSERDYARKGILKDRKAKSTPISEVMTGGVIVVSPKQTIDDCMQIMSEGRFRHLPVVDGDQVVGILSISDIVTAIIYEQANRIQSLEQYITGTY